jgi:hypothetical protein
MFREDGNRMYLFRKQAVQVCSKIITLIEMFVESTRYSLSILLWSKSMSQLGYVNRYFIPVNFLATFYLHFSSTTPSGPVTPISFG